MHKHEENMRLFFWIPERKIFGFLPNISFALSLDIIGCSTFPVHTYVLKTRACLDIHSRDLHAPLCGIFTPPSVNVARYVSLIWGKSPTNLDAQLTESNFQTRSSKRSGQHLPQAKAADAETAVQGCICSGARSS